MAGEVVRIEGLDELKRKLAEVPKAMRKRVLRNALAAGAREVRDVAKRNAPVMTLGTSLKAPYRKPGTVKQAIRVRTSKADRRAGDVGVFVNVRPAKGARFRGGKQVKATQRGAKSPNDPYYWRWVEFGTKRSKAVPFLRPAAQTLSAAFEAFKNALGPQLAKLNNDPKAPL